MTGGELLVGGVKGFGKTVKFLKTMPAWGWGLLLFGCAVVWLVDELVGWRSLLHSFARGGGRGRGGARDVTPRRPSALLARDADAWTRAKREPGLTAEAADRPPSFEALNRRDKEHRKESESAFAAVLSALDSITSWLGAVVKI